MKKISVILCTHNPNLGILRRALKSLKAQTFPEKDWELVFVDNHSEGLTMEGIRAEWDDHTSLNFVREDKVGLTHARISGFTEAQADLFVCIDDDNFFEPNYLEEAWKISEEHPTIGAFGGISVAEYEKKPSEEAIEFVRYMAVRDHGNQPIISRNENWGPWEPHGAGMVVRRTVAERFIRFWKKNLGGSILGRSGGQLLSGEDTILARCSIMLGYANAYQPKLKLTHYLFKERLETAYIRKLMKGHGVSAARIRKLWLGNNTEAPSNRAEAIDQLTRALDYRLLNNPQFALLHFQYDIGYITESWPAFFPKISILLETTPGEAFWESLSRQYYESFNVFVGQGIDVPVDFEHCCVRISKKDLSLNIQNLDYRENWFLFVPKGVSELLCGSLYYAALGAISESQNSIVFGGLVSYQQATEHRPIPSDLNHYILRPKLASCGLLVEGGFLQSYLEANHEAFSIVDLVWKAFRRNVRVCLSKRDWFSCNALPVVSPDLVSKYFPKVYAIRKNADSVSFWKRKILAFLYGPWIDVYLSASGSSPKSQQQPH